MKKSLKTILGVSTVLGSALGILSKSKPGKVLGFGMAGVSGAILLIDIFKEEKTQVEIQCQETERVIEESGLDLTQVETTDLMAQDEDETEEIVFGKTLLREAVNSCVFPDEMLEYDENDFMGTLHVLQNTEKNRIIISIPLPRKNRKGLCPQDVRQHFTPIFEDFIEDHDLDMKPFLNQIGVKVSKGDDGYIYYEEIEKEEDETFRDYLDRITEYIDLWAKDDKKFVNADYNSDVIDYQQYLNLEFPVFPRNSKKKGLDLISAMSLLKELTESMSIMAANTGREQTFEFNRVIFHPTDDYGTIFVRENGTIKTLDL